MEGRFAAPTLDKLNALKMVLFLVKLHMECYELC